MPGDWDCVRSVGPEHVDRLVETNLSFVDIQHLRPEIGADNPNQDDFPLDTTREWYFKGVGSYQLPWSVYTSTYVQIVSGALQPYGATQLSTLSSVNDRASKRLSLGRTMKLELVADLFNALNVNTVTSQSIVSGPTWGAISAIVPPRIVRLGTTFSF